MCSIRFVFHHRSCMMPSFTPPHVQDLILFLLCKVRRAETSQQDWAIRPRFSFNSYCTSPAKRTEIVVFTNTEPMKTSPSFENCCFMIWVITFVSFLPRMYKMFLNSICRSFLLLGKSMARLIFCSQLLQPLGLKILVENVAIYWLLTRKVKEQLKHL